MAAGLRKYRFLPRSPRCIAKGLVVFHPRFPNAKENICCRHWNEPHSKTVHERLSFVVALTPPGSATVTCTNSARLATFGVDSDAFFAKRSPIRSAGIATVAMAKPSTGCKNPTSLGHLWERELFCPRGTGIALSPGKFSWKSLTHDYSVPACSKGDARGMLIILRVATTPSPRFFSVSFHRRGPGGLTSRLLDALV
jgi:hypothetical protein